MIYYLVYLSAATELYNDDNLAQILTVSRNNNTQNDITGILLYHEGSIIQVLEGDKQTVNALYNKILLDRRHKSVIKMTEGMAEERSFADWSMAFKPLTTEEWNACSGYLSLDPSGFITTLKSNNSKINTLVKSFIKSGVL